MGWAEPIPGGFIYHETAEERDERIRTEAEKARTHFNLTPGMVKTLQRARRSK